MACRARPAAQTLLTSMTRETALTFHQANRHAACGTHQVGHAKRTFRLRTAEGNTMTDNNTPGMNREQVEAQRAIAEQQIASALKNFAQQLPNGMLYLQEAINEAGKTLDYLLRRTGLYEDASQFDQGTAPNPDLA